VRLLKRLPFVHWFYPKTRHVKDTKFCGEKNIVFFCEKEQKKKKGKGKTSPIARK
jgi:hypothetical protein